MNRTERKRQAKEDEHRAQQGIDVDSTDPASAAAMARHLHTLFERAKKTGTVDGPVKFLYARLTETMAAKPFAVACARGCSHCCNGWVSVTAPEILFAARRVRQKGEALMARVQAANKITKTYSMDERPLHPNPCAMLEDHACGLYEARPFACRAASSANATACERVFRLFAPETIPTPIHHIKTRELYQLALTLALNRAGLTYRYYDFTGGLARALSRADAEEAWLAGEDIFAGVPMDPTDLLAKPRTQLVSRKAFA